MLQPCQDNYSTTFASYDGMRRYHEKESLESRWHRCRVNELHIEPLDKASPLYGTPSAFAAGISAESVEDTAENLGCGCGNDCGCGNSGCGGCGCGC